MIAKIGIARKLKIIFGFLSFSQWKKLQPHIRAQGYLQRQQQQLYWPLDLKKIKLARKKCKLKDLRSGISHPLPRSPFFFPFPFLLMGKENTSSDRWLHISHHTYQRNCRPTCRFTYTRESE